MKLIDNNDLRINFFHNLIEISFKDKKIIMFIDRYKVSYYKTKYTAIKMDLYEEALISLNNGVKSEEEIKEYCDKILNKLQTIINFS